MKGKFAAQWCLGLLILALVAEELGATTHQTRDGPLQTLLAGMKGWARRACDDYEPKQCPDKDGAYPVFLPDNKDCNRFYECDDGSPILKDCPPGLDFDRWNHVCAEPEVAGCENCTN